MKTQGMYILIQGKEVEVTDPVAAIKQAKECVLLHEQALLANKKNSKVIYFKEAHDYWKEALSQLQTLQIKNQKLFE